MKTSFERSLLHLDLDYDREKLIYESRLIIPDYRNPQWVRGFALTPEAQRISMGGIPLFYTQRAGAVVKPHRDGVAKCCINIILSYQVEPIIIEGTEYHYQCALINVGEKTHWVNVSSADRLMLRIIFKEPYDVMASKLRDQQRVLS